MGRVGITYDQVADIAVVLKKAEITPTIEKVRQKLGTGSHGTISKHLCQWRANGEPPAPTKPSDALHDMTNALFEKIRLEAMTELLACKNDFEQTTESYNTAIENAAVKLKDANAAHQATTKELSRSKQEVDDLMLALNNSTTSLAESESAIKLLESKLSTLRDSLAASKNATANISKHLDTQEENQNKLYQQLEASQAENNSTTREHQETISKLVETNRALSERNRELEKNKPKPRVNSINKKKKASKKRLSKA